VRRPTVTAFVKTFGTISHVTEAGFFQIVDNETASTSGCLTVLHPYCVIESSTTISTVVRRTHPGGDRPRSSSCSTQIMTAIYNWRCNVCCSRLCKWTLSYYDDDDDDGSYMGLNDYVRPRCRREERYGDQQIRQLRWLIATSGELLKLEA